MLAKVALPFLLTIKKELKPQAYCLWRKITEDQSKKHENHLSLLTPKETALFILHKWILKRETETTKPKAFLFCTRGAVLVASYNARKTISDARAKQHTVFLHAFSSISKVNRYGKGSQELNHNRDNIVPNSVSIRADQKQANKQTCHYVPLALSNTE